MVCSLGKLMLKHLSSAQCSLLQTDLVGAACAVSVCAYAVLDSSVSTAAAGFAIICSLDLSSKLFWAMNNLADLQKAMTSLERLSEYYLVEQESAIGRDTPFGWPEKKGSVQVADLSLRYASHLPMVVQNLSLEVKAGEKVDCWRDLSERHSWRHNTGRRCRQYVTWWHVHLSR